jgi:hypothetical protein
VVLFDGVEPWLVCGVSCLDLRHDKETDAAVLTDAVPMGSALRDCDLLLDVSFFLFVLVLQKGA